LGETLGVADKSGRASTRDVIDSVIGQDAADFYNRHSAGIEAAGLLVGSILPGTLAVKALRLAQIGGVLAPAMEAATGLKNGDIVLDSAAVATAKQSVLRGAAVSGWKDANLFK